MSVLTTQSKYDYHTLVLRRSPAGFVRPYQHRICISKNIPTLFIMQHVNDASKIQFSSSKLKRNCAKTKGQNPRIIFKQLFFVQS